MPKLMRIWLRDKHKNSNSRIGQSNILACVGTDFATLEGRKAEQAPCGMVRSQG